MYPFCSLHCETTPYSVFENIEHIQEKWDHLLPENHHLKSENLLILQKTKPEHISFKYIIIEENQKPIGLAYLQLLNFNSRHYNNDLLNKPKLERIKSHIIKQQTNLLICGNLFRTNFQGFYFKHAKDNSLILGVLKNFAKKNPFKINFTGVLLKDCDIQFDEKEFKRHRYESFMNDITMYVPIKNVWSTFEDYLGELSRKYLQRAKKIRLAKESVDVKELNLAAITANGARIEELYLQVASRQSIKMGILNAQYFIEMKKSLGDSFKLTGYYFEEKLVAFSSYIIDGESIEIHYIGFDSKYNEQCKLYFNIIFDGIETAINNGMCSVELGRTALEAKASAGGIPVYNKNYIWVKLGLPTIVYNFFNKQYSNNLSEEWKNRFPFKEAPVTAQ